MNGEVRVEKEKVLLKETENENEPVDTKPRICTSCRLTICDRFLLKTNDVYWHEGCLRCCVCESQLDNACFYKDGRMFCRNDYARIHGCKCSGCDCFISPNELVMKALQNIYHVDCFKCDECGDKLEKGDEFILKDGKLYCRADFNVAEQRFDIDVFSSDEYDNISSISPTSPACHDKVQRTQNSCKRPRTILTSQQREDFKAAFEITPKPCRKVREQLSNETGLSVRVVQVWFQNQRAKLKKIQKKTDGSDIILTNSIEKVKKVATIGKSNKKKRNKSNSSTKSSDSSSMAAVSPADTSINNNESFQSMLGLNEDFPPPIMMPFLTNQMQNLENDPNNNLNNKDNNCTTNLNQNTCNNNNNNNNLINTSQHTLATLSSIAIEGMETDFNDSESKPLLSSFTGGFHALESSSNNNNTDATVVSVTTVSATSSNNNTIIFNNMTDTANSFFTTYGNSFMSSHVSSSFTAASNQFNFMPHLMNSCI